MSTIVDPRAQVSPKARLGANVSVGPFAIIEDDVQIGEGTTIGPMSFIGNGTRIGKDCRVHHAATIGHAPQDLKYNNEPTTCELGIGTSYANTPQSIGEPERRDGRSSAAIISSWRTSISRTIANSATVSLCQARR